MKAWFTRRNRLTMIIRLRLSFRRTKKGFYPTSDASQVGQSPSSPRQTSSKLWFTIKRQQRISIPLMVNQGGESTRQIFQWSANRLLKMKLDDKSVQFVGAFGKTVSFPPQAKSLDSSHALRQRSCRQYYLHLAATWLSVLNLFTSPMRTLMNGCSTRLYAGLSSWRERAVDNVLIFPH